MAAEVPSFSNIDWKTQEKDDEDALQRLLASTQEGETADLFNVDRPLDTGEKADNAQDYEDISDDDLPEEEEAEGGIEVDMPGLTDDMGTSHDTDDLFGDDRGYSPFDEFNDHDEHQPNGLQPPEEDINGPGPTSVEPEPEINLRELNFPEHYDTANQDPSIPAPAETEEELLKQSWPTFQRGTILNWNDLLPPKKARYIPKAPDKPPKPVNPTKISLEIATDQEKTFRTAAPVLTNKRKLIQEAQAKGLVPIIEDSSEEEDSDEGVDWNVPSPSEILGGVTWTDLEIICDDWESKINPVIAEDIEEQAEEPMDAWEMEILGHPAKRQKTKHIEKDIMNIPRFAVPSFDDFETSTKRSAKRVILDLNDPHLLVGTIEYSPAKRQRLETFNKAGKGGFSSSLGSRFNISNDEAYDALKENHQSKVRATLGNVTLEHSMPALKMQWPYYKTKLFIGEARRFHRPSAKFNKVLNQTIIFSKPLMRKRKQVKNMSIQDIFKESKDLSLADHYSSATLLEYSEEYPQILSNFGMGNRIINYYRRKDNEDTERPAPEDRVGDVTPLLPEDKSPFANFGEVDPGETVRTIHNAMYRAPIFKHKSKNTDFLVIRNSTGVDGASWYIRNIDHLFAVGQQFPSQEIPTPHSRRVTNVTKLRMKMLGLRLIRHSSDQSMRIADVTAHISGTSDVQNRQKLKEQFLYDKADKVWRLKSGEVAPEEPAIRGLLKPEDLCFVDAMQVGLQQLKDAGYEFVDDKGKKDDKKDDRRDDDDEDGKDQSLEQNLVPWKTTKAFLEASMNKGMLQLHGEGDPSGCGLAISMIRTSMKGGYIGALQGPSATSAAAIEAERKANGGHTYNVKRQEELYQAAIRDIWEKQKANLSDEVEHEENDMEREQAEEDARLGVGQDSMATPAGFDDSASMISGFSQNTRPGRVMRITRTVRNRAGILEENTVIIKDMRVWREYQKRRHAIDAEHTNVYQAKPTGNLEYDKAEAARLKKELARLERNRERRIGREKQKGGYVEDNAGSPSSTPMPTTEKPIGTTRKCANCGQAGHIKTNKKYYCSSCNPKSPDRSLNPLLCPMLNGTIKPEDSAPSGFGAITAPAFG